MAINATITSAVTDGITVIVIVESAGDGFDGATVVYTVKISRNKADGSAKTVPEMKAEVVANVRAQRAARQAPASVAVTGTFQVD